MDLRDRLNHLYNVRDALSRGDFMEPAAASMHAEQTLRIFNRGENSNGQKIGEYNDDTPLYVSPKNLPRKTAAKGKTGKKKFKNGRSHKTTYFDSYKDLREKQRRRTDRVDLVLFGDLARDFANSRRLGSPKITRVSNTVFEYGLGKRENGKKAIGLQRRYGRIFPPTRAEIQLQITVATQELRDLFNNGSSSTA